MNLPSIIEISLVIYVLLIFFFLSCPEDIHEWGKENINRTDNIWRQEDFVWKNWKKWTYGEILVTPIMAIMWSSFYIFVGLAMILSGIMYILFLNPLSKKLWIGFFKLLNKPISKNV